MTKERSMVQFLMPVVFLLGHSACGGDSRGAGQGEQGGRCYPNETCNEGLVCDVENMLCRVAEDPCAGVDCSGHGSCVVSGESASCNCDSGYHADGLACLQDDDPCAGVDCSGHGSCVVSGESASCNCDSGYHADGLACLQDDDPCAGVDCSGHGSCVVSGESASCSCDSGYHADGLACVEDSTTGSNRFDWGFQPFDVPDNVVDVPAGGDLLAAVGQVAGGGTLRLEAGIYTVTHLDLPSNVVLEGAGEDQTTVQSGGGGYVISVRGDSHNVIIRNLTVNAEGNGEANGLEIVYGPDNVLVENVEIFGAGKSNLIVWNPDESQASQKITFRNITSHDSVLYHCISFRIVHGGQILDSESYGCGGYGIDVSTSTWIELAGNYVHDSMGTKYPAADYLYIHDNNISDNLVDDGPGLKIQREGGPAGHLHIQDNEIVDNKASVRDWTTFGGDPHFAELVFKNNHIASTVDGGLVSIGTVGRLEVYGDNGTLTANHPATADPADDGVGVETW